MKSRLLKKLEEMALGRANDAVRLVYMNEEQAGQALDKLDLTMLSEIKRSSTGAVEVKLIDRQDIIELLLSQTQDGEKNGAAAFLAALKPDTDGRDKNANN